MADQKINALPTKATPTSGDKCLMSGAAEEYLIDYDQLATAILNKLTSKTYSLDQGTKTLIAALNELNSKTSKINIASNIISVQFTKWDETKVGYIINFEGGFVQMVVEKPETGGSATAKYYWNQG